MDFRTELNVNSSSVKLDLQDAVLTIGSCFSDDVGQKFDENKLVVNKNPFGTTYNPVSIHKLLLYALRNEKPLENGFIMRDGHWFHYDFHSVWNSKSKDELAAKLERQINTVHKFLIKAKVIIITYGTSWVYSEKELNQVVANCHKVVQQKFEKNLLTQKKIIESFDGFYNELRKINQQAKVILTVSPVRHIKDTLELNSVSKSILRLSCHTLSEAYADVKYFPSYEIMMDDLRDYRFYKEDMIHPNTIAIDYIWDKFSKTYLTDSAQLFIKDWTKIKSAIDHRPFNLESEAHQQFLKQTLQKLITISKTVDVQNEINLIKNQIIEV